MRRAATAVGLFFSLFTLTSGSATAVTDVEWGDAVQAAESVDPTLDAPPLTGTNVSAVGGGNSASNTNFGFSAFRRDGEVRGRMTVTDHLGNNLSANVVCIAAVVSPSGTGGLARLVGEVTDPASADRSMVFDVYDSGLPGGEGDMFNSAASPTPGNFPCNVTPPVDPIAHGNIAVRSLN